MPAARSMYLPGKIMKAGSSYLSAPADNGGNIPSAATTYVLDMTQASPAWTQTASMANPRTHLNLTSCPMAPCWPPAARPTSEASTTPTASRGRAMEPGHRDLDHDGQ